MTNMKAAKDDQIGPDKQYLKIWRLESELRGYVNNKLRL